MIKLIVLDVDGTMTNGQIMFDQNGNEFKSFCVKDGLAIASWNKYFNLKSAIITGRQSLIVEKRAKELQITYLYQKEENKLNRLKQICNIENISLNEVGAIGDDLNDLAMLKAVGISFAPNNAVDLIKQNVNIVCKNNGGNGAIREMIEYILQYNNMDGLESRWV
jgi:3-deoxy-D-manno-octulosonate 8-phosphate phosphatase (KDO 8-P phosphatase)